jgi:V8-like Glu-specific endopeptidase
MAWTKKMAQLNDVLADLVYNHQGIIALAQNSGIKPAWVNLSGNAEEIWNSVINEADKRNKVDELIAVVSEKFPENPFLAAARSFEIINYSLQPVLDEISSWSPLKTADLEVLTMEKSTMLPISFLEKGILKSKSVAKIEIRTGNIVDVGTGFLFRIPEVEGLYFMTNHHVIRNLSKLRSTNILFNFELDSLGNSKQSETFEINPDGFWLTSPINELDVTICELLDRNDSLKNYGYLELREIDVSQFDFVNIIQHPGGQWKQLSIYHNIVTSTDDRIVQYLTDTLKGSSGAPVFNSDWDVVALHHSGGELKDDEMPLPFGFKSRNEGIRINQIIQFFKNEHSA